MMMHKLLNNSLNLTINQSHFNNVDLNDSNCCRSTQTVSLIDLEINMLIHLTEIFFSELKIAKKKL